MSVQLTPQFGNVQAHYDLSDDFFRLFLDPTQTYSCAYFERDDMTLQEAQIAKIDLALGKLESRARNDAAGHRLRLGRDRAARHREVRRQRCGPDAVQEPGEHVQKMFDEMDTPRSRRVLLEGWEKFQEPVDRIVSIGAFEHFGRQRYERFFKMTYQALPADGIMLLHTICREDFKESKARGAGLTREIVHFTQFILAEIFPGGWLPTIKSVGQHAAAVGFKVTRTQSLQLHYAKTLDIWAAALEANRKQAIAIQSEKVYDSYMKYLTGCADLFHTGYTDVAQYTLEK